MVLIAVISISSGGGNDSNTAAVGGNDGAAKLFAGRVDSQREDQEHNIVKGGKVSGKVVFEVGATKGDFYVIYKPDPFDAARGIWKTTA